MQFNQTKDPEGKQHLYAELAKYGKSKARIIDKEGYEYYSRWQNSIVRAFFGIDQKENNPAAIGKKVFPPIPAKEVEEAIALLSRLGLISKTANGFALRDPNIATERENKDFVGKLRIVEMLRLAQDVFNHVPPERSRIQRHDRLHLQAGLPGPEGEDPGLPRRGENPGGIGHGRR